MASAQPADPRRLAEAFPDSASVRLRLLNAYYVTEDEKGLRQVTLWLAERGHTFSESVTESLLALFPADEREELEAAFSRNEASLTASSLIAYMPASIELVESAARDPGSGVLWATSVVSRSLVVQARDGAWKAVKLSQAGSLSGLVFDPRRKLLWVASAVVDQTPSPENAFRGLIAVDPESRREVARYAMPGTASPGDIALGTGGSVYASDPLGGGIYVLHPDGAQIAELVAPGTFRSPQGIAPAPDGALLHISDYRYGLAAINLASGKVLRVRAGVPLMLDGIDGLWRYGDSLVAVQNGSQPMRIVRILLSPDGLEATGAEVLEQAHPDWTEPVGGSLSGDELIYVATGQWDRFGEQGKIFAGAESVATRLHSLPLADHKSKSR